MNEAETTQSQDQAVEDAGFNEVQGYDPDYVDRSNVAATDNSNSNTYQVDWESEAKKFQSMNDKNSSENQKMRKDMEYLVQEFAKTQNQSTVPSKEPALPEDEFNPWDAYYKPESASYKFRKTHEQETVNQAMSQQKAEMNEQMLINNTVSDLRSVHNLSENEVQDFMQWSTNPSSNLSLDTLIDVWKGETERSILPAQREEPSNSLAAVKAAKEAPRSAGVLQGSQPEQKSDIDKVWEQVMSASGRSNVL